MALTEADIKFFKSQKLTQADDAGGGATGDALNPNLVGELFNPLSSYSRVYGVVEFIKLFLGLDTLDTSQYLGGLIALTKKSVYPQVNYFLSESAAWNEKLLEKKTAIESGRVEGADEYVLGAQVNARLFSSIDAGAGQLVFVSNSSESFPYVLPKFSNGFYFLIKNEGLSTEQRIFFQITALSSSPLSLPGLGCSVSEMFTIETATLADPVDQDIIADDFNCSLSGGTINIYQAVPSAIPIPTGVPAYGVSAIEAATSGASTIRALTTQQQLVPSADYNVGIDPSKIPESLKALIIQETQVLLIHESKSAAAPTLAPGVVIDLGDENVSGCQLLDADGRVVENVKTPFFAFNPLNYQILTSLTAPWSSFTAPFVVHYKIISNEEARTESVSTITAGDVIQLAIAVPIKDLKIVDGAGLTIYENDQTYFTDNYLGKFIRGVFPITGYATPFTINYRIQDLAVCSGLSNAVGDAADIALSTPITHDYTGAALVSSCLPTGDLFARQEVFFDQQLWDKTTWLDAVSGAGAGASYNLANNPIELENKGTISERWAIYFTGSSTFELYGEAVGVVAQGSLAADFAPLNPYANTPYFLIRQAGWGSGWVPGNILRFNTIAAAEGFWVIRSTLQGSAADQLPNDAVHLASMGNAV